MTTLLTKQQMLRRNTLRTFACTTLGLMAGRSMAGISRSASTLPVGTNDKPFSNETGGHSRPFILSF